jgi:hypothetical protein
MSLGGEKFQSSRKMGGRFHGTAKRRETMPSVLGGPGSGRQVWEALNRAIGESGKKRGQDSQSRKPWIGMDVGEGRVHF